MKRNNSDFEYVGVKIEDDEKQYQDMLEEEMKCGTIFMTKSYTYTLVCEFCERRFQELESFGIHLKTKHITQKSQETVPLLLPKSPDSSIPTEATVAIKLFESDPFTPPDKITKVENGETDYHLEYPLRDDAHFEDTFKTETTDEEDDDKPLALLKMTTGESERARRQAKRNSIKSEAETIESNRVELEPKPMIEINCDLCDKTFTRKSTLTKHLNWHRVYGTWPALYDKQRIRDRKAERLHKRKANQKRNPKLYCSICDRQFQIPYQFRTHAEMNHGNEIPLALQNESSYLQCRYCGMDFSKVSERLAHEATHNTLLPYKCTLCSQAFRAKNLLEAHYRRTHEGLRPYPCTECSKTFTSAGNLKSHRIRVHTGERPFACQYCGKNFPAMKDVRRHERIHTDEKPYQCEDCGARFRTSDQLKLHKKRRAKIKDFKCDFCDKSFLTRAFLQDHRVLHTKEKPYECEQCEKRFPRKKALQAHRQLHTGVKRYECTICGKRFAQPAGLYTHKKTHKEITS